MAKRITKAEMAKIADNVLCSVFANSTDRDEQIATAEFVVDGLTGREWESYAPRQLSSSEAATVLSAVLESF